MTTESEPNDVKSYFEKLAAIPGKYANPDPSIVSKLPKGGTELDYVGHADVTMILLEIDPLWTWEPLAYDDDGLPRLQTLGKTLYLWAWLTILGERKLEVGSVAVDKNNALKELTGDFLRRAAMRFGIGTKLWSKSEQAEAEAAERRGGSRQQGRQQQPRPPRNQQQRQPEQPPATTESPTEASAEQKEFVRSLHARFKKLDERGERIVRAKLHDEWSLQWKDLETDPSKATMLQLLIQALEQSRGQELTDPAPAS